MTEKLRKAAEQALESLLELVPDPQIDFGPAYEGAKQRRKKATAALRAALAEQTAEQEPVAYMLPRDGDDCAIFREPGSFATRYSPKGWTPLYTTPQPAKRVPLTLWTEAQHERAYRNSPELHKDVKSLAAFKRVAKEIAAMYGITGETE